MIIHPKGVISAASATRNSLLVSLRFSTHASSSRQSQAVMPGSVRRILYAALLLAPQSLLSEGGLCSDERFGKLACNSDEDCSPGICDPSTPSGTCASGCHAAAEGDPCFTDDECSRFRVSCECVYPEVVPPAASPTPPVNNPPPATPTTPTGGGGVAPEDNPATPPPGPASNITGDGDDTGTYVGIGVGATLLVCCICCCWCFCHVERWEKLRAIEERRKKVGLPKTATDAECQYAERRQNLFISSTATEEECVAAEAIVAAARAEREAARKRAVAAAAEACRDERERDAREEGYWRLIITLHLPPGHTIPGHAGRDDALRADADRAMLVGLTGTATVEEVLRREERQHICGRWDASDEAFRHAKDEWDRERARRCDEAKAKRAAAYAIEMAKATERAELERARNNEKWARQMAAFDTEMAERHAKTAWEMAQTKKEADLLEARAQARLQEEADWLEARTAKREATAQGDAAATEREQQFAEQKAPVVQKARPVAATFLVPEEQRLGEYHSSHDGSIYYKGERLDHGGFGGLEDFGGGYARNGDGTVWFHGKVVEGVNAQYNSFHVAGNGYAVNQGVIVYAGKVVEATTGVYETGLDHLGDGWSRTRENTYLFRGEVVPANTARVRCPRFAEVGVAAVKPEEGTEDNDFLVPEEQRLGGYHSRGPGGYIFYKGEQLGQSTGLEDFGDGYARDDEGTVWFHGKVMEGVNAQYNRFTNAGNGYAVNRGVLYYLGKEIGADGVSVYPTPGREPLDHLGDGWSRTWPPHHVYFYRGEVVSMRAARTRCPHFAERDQEQETIDAVANNHHTLQGRVLF